MTIKCCAWPTVNVSNSLPSSTCFLKSRIWLWLPQPLSAGLVQTLSLLPPRSSMHLFECMVLVSQSHRCGMVYVDSEELRWLPFVQTFMTENGKRLREETKEYIMELFTRYIDPGLTFVKKKCTQGMQQVGNVFIYALFSLVLPVTRLKSFMITGGSEQSGDSLQTPGSPCVGSRIFGGSEPGSSQAASIHLHYLCLLLSVVHWRKHH